MFSSVPNFLSGILAIIIALTSLSGGLVTGGADRPFTVEFGIEQLEGDPASLGVAGQSEATTSAVMKLLGLISFRLSANGTAARMDVKLNGDPAASFAVQKQDGGWAAVSDLFPSLMLTVKDETLSSFTAAQGSSVPSIPEGTDPAVLIASVQEPFEKMMEAFRDKAGEPETGSFTVGNVEFTQKTPYNITTKEALELLVGTAKTILEDESVASLIAQFKPDFTPESLDQALEKIQAGDDSEQPALSVAEYSNETGDTALEITLEKDGKTVSFNAVTSGSVTTVSLNVPGSLDALLALDQENKEYSLNLQASAYEGPVSVAGSLSVGEEGGDLSIDFSIPAGRTPFSGKINAHFSFEEPVFEAAEGLEVIPVEDLVGSEEAASSFNTKVMQGLLKLLLVKAREYPELVTLMTPSENSQPAVVEEAPAEEAPTEVPPVVEAPAA